MNEHSDQELSASGRRWQPYPAYKDSGVEWLGEIPAHWEAKRLRHACELNPRKSELAHLPSDTRVSFLPMEKIGEDGDLELDETRTLEQVWQGYTYFRDDDVVVAKITPCFENGKGALLEGLLNGVGFGTTELHVLRAKNGVDPKFVVYLTRSYPFRHLGTSMMYGAAGQQRVPEDFVKDFNTGVPPLQEQRTIVAFLDRETTKLDTLVAKQERLIELLQEKRVALISHAVTKGIDSTVPMRSSGLGWVDKIPVHWPTIRNGALFEQRDERGFPDLPILEVSIHTGTSVREFSSDRIEQMAADRSIYKRARKGDITFNKMRMWQGAVGVAPTDGLVSPDYTVARPREDICTRYFEHLFRTTAYRTEVNRHSHGIVPDRNRLYWDQFKQIVSLCPPFEEQRAIVNYLDRETSKIDTLIAKAQEMIERLQEYRTALISAAVTGKIDVREA